MAENNHETGEDYSNNQTMPHPCVEIPIQEQPPEAQSYLESGLKRNLLLYRYDETEMRDRLARMPIQEKIPATQSYLESGGAKGESALVSTRQSNNRQCTDVHAQCGYKRRFPSPSPIWKVATTKGESALVSARTPKTEHAQGSRLLKLVYRGRFTNELLLQT